MDVEYMKAGSNMNLSLRNRGTAQTRTSDTPDFSFHLSAKNDDQELPEADCRSNTGGKSVVKKTHSKEGNLARQLRIEFPGAVYHITSRGVARSDIFLSAEDRATFLGFLAEVHERMKVTIHCYCLMSNHFHLDLETPEANISNAMKWLNQRYAMYFNRTHDRVGCLFQGRYHAVLVETDSHLHELTRYIHLNPVRANMVNQPAEYLWSSYRSYIGLDMTPTWLEIEPTLRRFSGAGKNRHVAYRDFVEQPGTAVINPLLERQFGVLLGSKQFIEQIQSRFSATIPGSGSDIAQLTAFRRTAAISAIVETVAEVFSTRKEKLRQRGIRNNYPREIALFLASRHTNLSRVELGTYFGGVSAAGVDKICARVRNRSKRNGPGESYSIDALDSIIRS